MVGADVRGETLRMRLDRRLATPLFRQVYQRVRDAILDGTLRPGATLPSSRSLAAQLSTARGTVELAYAVLAGEGYIVGNTTSRTMVNPGLRHFPGAGSDNELRRTIIQPHPAPDRPASARPFQMGLPAHFWAKVSTRCISAGRRRSDHPKGRPHPALKSLDESDVRCGDAAERSICNAAPVWANGS